MHDMYVVWKLQNSSKSLVKLYVLLVGRKKSVFTNYERLVVIFYFFLGDYWSNTLYVHHLTQKKIILTKFIFLNILQCRPYCRAAQHRAAAGLDTKWIRQTNQTSRPSCQGGCNYRHLMVLSDTIVQECIWQSTIQHLWTKDAIPTAGRSVSAQECSISSKRTRTTKQQCPDACNHELKFWRGQCCTSSPSIIVHKEQGWDEGVGIPDDSIQP